MMCPTRQTIAVIILPLLLSGCMFHSVNYKAPSATAADPKSAQNEYWFAKPATQSVQCRYFDRLWDAAAEAARERSFLLDSRDYREGVLSTKPLVSKQPFEFWRGDVVTVDAQVQCSLSTMRRTARFYIKRLDDGTFLCEPKVVVERYAMPERRITSVDQYLEAFSTLHAAESDLTEEGEAVRTEYWYAVGRDSALERALAELIRSKVPSITLVRVE
jgi:hypothetical protein